MKNEIYYGVYTANDMPLCICDTLKEVSEFLGYNKSESLSRTISRRKSYQQVFASEESVTYLMYTFPYSVKTKIGEFPKGLKIYKFTEKN